MRIYLSSTDYEHAGSVAKALGQDVYACHDADGDATWVDADDELAGAALLAKVHNALAEAREEADDDHIDELDAAQDAELDGDLYDEEY